MVRKFHKYPVVNFSVKNHGNGRIKVEFFDYDGRIWTKNKQLTCYIEPGETLGEGDTHALWGRRKIVLWLAPIPPKSIGRPRKYPPGHVVNYPYRQYYEKFIAKHKKKEIKYDW